MKPIKRPAAAIAIIVVGLMPELASAVPSFSGAEGWGAVTAGGRGGQVIHVTNLNDSGPGSFRAAVTASGPRTVVFDVSGQINLLSEVSVTNPFLTIAGQTAPGAGVTIAGETVSLDTHDIVVRYLRFRRGSVDANRRDDALGSDRTKGNIIIDHVSASWGLDENLSVYRNKLDQPIVPGGSTVLPARNVTIQWSISSEALNPFDHAFGSTVGGAGVNFHHNLWASNTGRNPSISFSHFMDFRNNVLFNWRHRSVDGAGEEAHVNMVNNYYKPGPATQSGQLQHRIVKPELRDGVVGAGEAGWWYVEGNHVVGNPTVTANNWSGGVQFDQPGMQQSWVRATTPHNHVQFPDDPDDPNDDVGGVPIPIPALPIVATQSALDAYQSVLAGAGATLPVRDAVDVRVTNSVSTGIATAGPGGNGIITDVSQVGGYPVLPFEQRAANWDADQDGMPNAWENNHGLNPADAADRNGDFDADGYTNLDDYLNDAGAFRAVQEVVWDGSVNNRYAQIENWNIAFQPSRFDAAAINSGTAVVDAVGQHAGTLKIASANANSAQLNITGGRLEVANEVIIGGAPAAQGVLNVSGGELRTPKLSKGAAGAFNFTGGMLRTSEVGFPLTNNGGTFAPGDSPATTTVLGDLTLNDGILEIEIGGRGEGEYDRLEVHGKITFGGTLQVKLVDVGQGVYEPQAGDLFGVFFPTTGQVEGEFDDFDLPPLAPGLAWALLPGDVTVFLGVVPTVGNPADFNDDAHVDSADLAAWTANFGKDELATHAQGDFDADGDADGRDFLGWQREFGFGLPTSVGVPEPTSLLLTAIVAAAGRFISRSEMTTMRP
jgi:pectate lyase